MAHRGRRVAAERKTLLALRITLHATAAEPARQTRDRTKNHLSLRSPATAEDFAFVSLHLSPPHTSTITLQAVSFRSLSLPLRAFNVQSTKFQKGFPPPRCYPSQAQPCYPTIPNQNPIRSTHCWSVGVPCPRARRPRNCIAKSGGESLMLKRQLKSLSGRGRKKHFARLHSPAPLSPRARCLDFFSLNYACRRGSRTIIISSRKPTFI